MPSLEAIAVELPPLEDVISSYTGRVGCMCGCLGKHYYASAHRKFSSKNRAYEVRDSEVSDRAVKRAYNKLLKLVSTGKVITNCTPLPKTNYMYFEKGDRCTAIYFKY